LLAGLGDGEEIAAAAAEEGEGDEGADQPFPHGACSGRGFGRGEGRGRARDRSHSEWARRDCGGSRGREISGYQIGAGMGGGAGGRPPPGREVSVTKREGPRPSLKTAMLSA